MSTIWHTTLNYFSNSGLDGVLEGVEVSGAEVTILDGRLAQLPGWEECGFELTRHSSAVTDWMDDAEIAAVHYAEIEELARKMTGADLALVSSHIRRSPTDAKRHRQLSPIPFVHSDFAAGHADLIRRSYHESNEVAATLARNRVTADLVSDAPRIVILQFWRNLGPAKMDYPIAFCDARSVTPAEGRVIHVTDYAGSGSNFNALGIVVPDDPSPHKWYTFSELSPDELIAFRTYDTDLVRDGKTWFTPHSAFRDPEVAIGEPARTSIELRATCLFDLPAS
jgi:hypothetical protein